MSAQDYPVSFAYGDVDGYYYTSNNVHRGNDRPTPSGTPIVIGGTTIGHTGNTGLTSGPHLHTQAGIDEWCQQTVEPSPYEFQPGTVVNAGYGSQWGNYIIIRTLSGVYICYAHLSNINVHDGQVITERKTVVIENTSAWKTRMSQVLKEITGDTLSDEEFNSWVNAEPFSVVEALIDDKKRAAKNDVTSDADSRIKAFKDALNKL